MTDTQALIARLEAATGPDRELDAAIYAAMNPEMQPIPNLKGRFFNPAKTTALAAKDYHLGKGVTDVAPSYTSSIDAALTLVPSTMNATIDTRKPAAATLGGEWVYAATPALAICIAALRAGEGRCGGPDILAEITRLRATLRQIADSGNSMNAHLARSVLENEHGNG